MSTRALVLFAAASLVTVAPPSVRAQSPTLDELLDRTAAHIRSSVPRLANVVCEEEYVQRRRDPAPERRLRSDFLLVPYPPSVGVQGWMVFRDVLEVDGTPAAEQQQRVRDLFVEPSGDAVARAIRIAVEGLRYHVRGFPPALVNPLSAIIFLQEENRPALRFRRGDLDRSHGSVRGGGGVMSSRSGGPHGERASSPPGRRLPG